MLMGNMVQTEQWLAEFNHREGGIVQSSATKNASSLSRITQVSVVVKTSQIT
jgi:hypothetical protein